MPDLFSPIGVGHVTFANRLVMPPMVRFTGEMPEEVARTGGRVNDAVVEHYARRVRAGTGMIIVEATAVDAQGRCWADGFGLYEDGQIDDLAKVARGIKAAGGVACIQLVHGGPQASPELCGGTIVGPSAIGDSEKSAVPEALTVAAIQTIEQRFVDAARRAVKAGFDAVEIHGAHGYLLDSFLMQRRNQRTDEYGGTREGRMRMLLETCQKVKGGLPGSALVLCRISPFTKRDEGYSLDDLTALVRGLEKAGIDLLHLSTDGAFKTWFGSDKTLGQHVGEITRLPRIVAGGLRQPADAQRLLDENHADFAAVGTAMLREADWAAKAREQLRQ